MAIIKTTIGIPDKIYILAEEITKKLNIPRSQLYTSALEAYVQNYLDHEMAQRLDEAFSEPSIKEDEDLQKAFVNGFNARMEEENESW